MESSKKILLSTIGFAVLIVILSGITFAFFNYTRTGVSNSIKVGRISFVTRELGTINLTNVFPISSSEATGENPNYDEVVIEIVGDTDYSGGIEYLVSAVDANIYTNTGQAVPISLDIKIDDDLGTENNNYFVARDNTNTSIYKKIVGDTLVGDGMLLVGYIKPNSVSGTPDGIDGTITIKAYLDKDKILISDTYDGNESDNMGTTNSQAEGKTVITTTEWNALQQNGLSFKVKVEANEAIWVVGSLEEIMRKNAVMDNINSDYVDNTTPGINFREISSDTNGKGVYTRAGTENDENPIVYYRGAVEDNNVVFNNKCWKAVRTTDTGGVKLIYNGESRAIYSDATLPHNQYTIVTNTDGTNTDVWTFDSTDNSWNVSSTSQNIELSFKVPARDGYKFEMTGQIGSSSGGSYTLFKETNLVNGGGAGSDAQISLNHSYGTLTADDVVKFAFAGGTFTTPTTIKIKMIAPLDLVTENGCDNSMDETQISLDIDGVITNKFAFNESSNSPAYVGYMHGNAYALSRGNWSSAVKYGSSFTWDGTYYKLDGSIVTYEPDSTHHYSCNSPLTTATCTELRYVYNGEYKEYIILRDGIDVEDALAEMQQNKYNSNAKDKVETWYADNMADYTNRIEDTIYCNDRSIVATGENSFQNSGWSIGGDLTKYAELDSYVRLKSGSPSLSCINKNDSFTWKNNEGNKKLAYPVGLITVDELTIAGAVIYETNGDFYLRSNEYYWTMSPASFYYSSAVYNLYNNGYATDYATTYARGLRPAISLKPGQLITKGTGIVTDPYIIK